MCCLTSFDLVELLGLMFLVVSVHQIGHEDNKLCCKCCQKHCSRGARDLRAGYFSLRLTTFASCVLVGHVSFHMIDTVPNLPWKQAGINFVWKHCMYLKLGRENKARFKVGQNPTSQFLQDGFLLLFCPKNASPLRKSQNCSSQKTTKKEKGFSTRTVGTVQNSN